MAIKKRHRPAVDLAAIEAFGDAADAPQDRADATAGGVSAPAARSAVAVQSGNRGDSEAASSEVWPEGLAKTFLLRFPDPQMPLQLEQLQKILGRNKHQTLLLALRRGLEALRLEAEELGDRADLIS